MVRQEIGIRKKSDKKSEDASMGFGDWGGYMAAKRAKLLEQFHDTKIDVISDIFKGIAIHVNGLTKPPIDVLKNLMATHGGLFHAYQTSSTTHIIASNLASVKIKRLGSIPIVKPSWITDCVDMGKLLNYQKYLLYTNQSISQPALQFEKVRDSRLNIKEDLLDNEKDMQISTENENKYWDNSDVGVSTSQKSKNTLDYEENVKEPCISSRNVVIEDNSNQLIEKRHETDVTQKSKIIDDNNCDGCVKNRSKTAADPNFLEEFYNNSRLHLISTLGAEYKQLVNELREKSIGHFPGKEKLIGKGKITYQKFSEPVIMHIDMDCFFASVGLRNQPELKGKPVAVAHARNGELKHISAEQKLNREQEYALYSERLPVGVTSRVDKIDTLSSMSEIASCSYEARSFGIRNGMFLGQAIKMCPDLKVLPYDFEGYKEVSRALYNIIASYTLDIEAVSCDEMYVDITKLLHETGLSIDEWADYIRNEITVATRCTCSTGFGSNRLQARLATRKAKPAGKFYLTSQNIESYMAEIPLADLPGVGRAALAKLQNMGLNTCGDIQTTSLSVLQNIVGHKFGETLKEQAVGIDRKPLSFSHARKSVSAEINFGIRFKDHQECHNFLQGLSNEVYKRLNSINMKSRCVTLKLLVRSEDAPLETAKFLGHGICDSLSKSSGNVLINDSKAIYKEVLSLYNRINPCVTDLRGIGIQLSKLEKIAPINSTISNFLKTSTKISKGNFGNKSEELQRSTSNETTFIEKKPVKSAFFSNHSNNTFPENCDGLSRFIKGGINKSIINADVLKEIPDEFQCETITHYNLEETGEITKASTQERGRGTDYESSPFSGLNWEEMKPLIKRWAISGEQPEEFDIIMIGKHFKAYAMDRKIELLFTVLNSLYRMFSNLPCEWHKAYFTIVNIAQEGMIARYGNTLMVNRIFKCCQS